VTVWDEIQFPFDPALRDVESAAVQHSAAARLQQIEEKYSIDASGTVTITISNLSAAYERAYRLGRWAAKDALAATAKPRMRHPTRKQAEGRRR
jgi:hypothetical protein